MRHNSYKSIRSIGGGNFGRVELVQNKSDGKQYVMKKLRITQSNKQTIQKQIDIMSQLCHQYIIRFYESFPDEEGNVCIVMENAEKGELQKYLNSRKANNKNLSEDEVLEWFIQMCLGLKFVHDHKVLHRDIKCENIFINANNQIKIGDFGISKTMKETLDMAQTKIGTPCVMAPEIWQNKMYNQKSDIWSLGCVLYKMMAFAHAFESQNMAGYVIKITSGNYPPIRGNYSSELKNLVKQMLSQDAQDRPSVHRILQMPFIRRKLSDVLLASISKYQSTIEPVLEKQKSGLSNQRLKRSFSSLSNSSLLTPKNSTNLDNTKMVQLKQRYPLLLQEVKNLKQKAEQEAEQKKAFTRQCKLLINQVQQGLSKTQRSLEVERALQKLNYKIQQLSQN